MSTIDVFVPTKPTSAPAVAKPAPRDAVPEHPVLELICNGKPRARELLELVAEELDRSLGFAHVEMTVKPGASMTLSDAELAEIARRADLAIAALGDCGACSACSLNDAIGLERLGIPTTTIITEVFQQTAADFSRNLGMAGYQSVVVPHPVSSRSLEALRAVAADAAPVARRLIVAPTPAQAG
jgi:hypothetical protein